MNEEYFNQAELALAAYAKDLDAGTEINAKLENAGLSSIQAESFANTYHIVDQYNDPGTGLSATIFRHTTDVFNTNSFLAIRGTEITDINDLFAGLSIATVGTTQLQRQSRFVI